MSWFVLSNKWTNEPRNQLQIHFLYDFPDGYIQEAVVRRQWNNPCKEVRNDAVREQNTVGQAQKIKKHQNQNR